MSDTWSLIKLQQAIEACRKDYEYAIKQVPDNMQLGIAIKVDYYNSLKRIQ